MSPIILRVLAIIMAMIMAIIMVMMAKVDDDGNDDKK